MRKPWTRWSRRAGLLLLLSLAGCDSGKLPGVSGDAALSDGNACGAAATPISAIQGATLRSPQQGAVVVVEAVIVGDYVASLGGIFLQEEQNDRDGDPLSSEGIFVRIDGAAPKLELGEVLRVKGTVAELGEGERSQTALVELNGLKVCAKTEMPQLTLVEQAPLVAADWEAFEGMRLALDPAATIVDNSELMHHGELMLSLNGRHWIPTERHAPGADARALAAENARQRLILDDASLQEGPDRIRYLPEMPSTQATYRIGSQVLKVEGVLDQRDGRYLLYPQARIQVNHAARPESAPEVNGDVRVVSMNLLNFFNGDGRGEGFPTERGASSREEFQRQRAKLISTMKALDADLYALSELENDGYERRAAIEELTQRLNQAIGRSNAYRYISPGTAAHGGDQIAVGFIYRARSLKPVGPPAAPTDHPAFLRGNRLPLAQTFDSVKNQGRFTAVANHWKSKGGCQDADEANQDRGDGQGCFNATRVEAARALADWLSGDPTQSGDPDVLLLGDFNAYSQEDPIRLLAELGYSTPQRGQEPHYSFVFRGESGSLDHALASASLREQVRDFAVWHINADELIEFDYNREHKNAQEDARMFRADPFRSSDHDPLMLGLDLDPPAPPEEAAVEAAAQL